jgi:hypothetical protein
VCEKLKKKRAKAKTRQAADRVRALAVQAVRRELECNKDEFIAATLRPRCERCGIWLSSGNVFCEDGVHAGGSGGGGGGAGVSTTACAEVEALYSARRVACSACVGGAPAGYISDNPLAAAGAAQYVVQSCKEVFFSRHSFQKYCQVTDA